MARALEQDLTHTTNEGEIQADASHPFLPESRSEASTIISNRVTRIPKAGVGANLTFFNGLALVIGLQIGSGIFLAPSQISVLVPAPGLAVLLWSFAGLFVWTGAASFIELGLAIPRNGGVQEYLQFCYGDFVAFVFTSTWVLLIKPAAMAMIAIVFSSHLCQAIYPDGTPPTWVEKLIALLGLSVVTVVNCAGLKTGPKAANIFLVLKLCTVYSIAILGLVMIIESEASAMKEPGFHWFNSTNTTSDRTNGVRLWDSLGDYVTAFYAALFCFAGWESIGFVAGDMKSPSKHLPPIINFAMMVVIVGFVLANVAFYAVLPIEIISESQTVAADFGRTSMGAWAGLLYSLAISASALGALNVNVFATGRLCVAASKRGYFPGVLANLHVTQTTHERDYYSQRLSNFPKVVVGCVTAFASWTADLRVRQEVPVYAMIMNTFISFVYTICGSFGALSTFVGIAEYMFFFLAVWGLRSIRGRLSKGPSKAFKTWTFNPIIFCAGAFIVALISLEWLSYHFYRKQFVDHAAKLQEDG